MLKNEQSGVEEKDHWKAAWEEAILNVDVHQVPSLQDNVPNRIHRNWEWPQVEDVQVRLLYWLEWPEDPRGENLRNGDEPDENETGHLIVDERRDDKAQWPEKKTLKVKKNYSRQLKT